MENEGRSRYIVVTLTSTLSRLAEFTKYKMVKCVITQKNQDNVVCNNGTVFKLGNYTRIFKTREEAEEYIFKDSKNYMYVDFTRR